MSSNVIHIRLDDESLLSMLEYTEKFIPLNKNAPLGTQTAFVIRSCMQGLIESGAIPKHEPSAIVQLLRDKLGVQGIVDNAPSFSPQVTNPDDLIPKDSPLNEQIEDGESPRDKMRELINAGINSVTQPDIELDAKVFTPDPDELPDIDDFRLNIESLDMISDEEVRGLSIKGDIRLSAIDKMDGIEYAIELMTLRIVYFYLNPADSYSPHGEYFYNDIKKHVTIYLKKED